MSRYRPALTSSTTNRLEHCNLESMENSLTNSAAIDKGYLECIDPALVDPFTTHKEEVEVNSPQDAGSPYKRRRVGSHSVQNHSLLPSIELPETPTEALSSAASTADLEELEKALDQARGRSFAASGPFRQPRAIAPAPAKRWSPILPSTEYDESELEWEDSSTPRNRSASPDDRMAMAAWRVKGRFLEYQVTFKDDAKDTTPLWVQAHTMPPKEWKTRISHFFQNDPAEYKKYMMTIGHDHGSGKIEFNWSPRVYRATTADNQTLIWMTNEGDVGDKYKRYEGPKLDKAAWEETIARYWRERLYKIREGQVQALVKGGSSNRIADYQKNIIPYDEGPDLVSEAIFEKKMAAAGV